MNGDGLLTPMNCWSFLRNQHDQSDVFFESDVFFDNIFKTLVELCFDIEDAATLGQLRISLPLMQKRLVESKPINRRIKIAHDVASYVGFKDVSKLKRTVQERLLFEGALFVLLSFKPGMLDEAGITPYATLESFLSVYPEFVDCDITEQRKLLDFCNFMKYGVVLLAPPKWKKAHLLDLATRLTEGKKKKYHCGGGQTPATNRRVIIYERESGVTPVPITRRKIPWEAVANALNGCTHDVADHLIDTIHESELGRLEAPKEMFASFSHPLEPSVQVDASELVSADESTVVRTVTVKRCKTDLDGNTVWSDLTNSVSVMSPVDTTHSSTEFWNETELAAVEIGMFDGLNVSRQTSCVDGQMFRGVSLCKHSSLDDWDLDFFSEDINLSDMMRGGGLFPSRTGSCGLTQTFSAGSVLDGEGGGSRRLSSRSNSTLWGSISRAVSRSFSAPNPTTSGRAPSAGAVLGSAMAIGATENDNRRQRANFSESEWNALGSALWDASNEDKGSSTGGGGGITAVIGAKANPDPVEGKRAMTSEGDSIEGPGHGAAKRLCV